MLTSMAIVSIILFILAFIFTWRYVQDDIIGWVCATIVRRSIQYCHRNHAKRIILIRHGESEGNKNENVYANVPDHAIGLTDKGCEQSRLCGERLKQIIDSDESIMFYYSPFRRSKQTCEIISQAFSKKQLIRLREDPRIREQEWSVLSDQFDLLDLFMMSSIQG
jgi:Histidine phosphatase superfamily (branch 1)